MNHLSSVLLLLAPCCFFAGLGNLHIWQYVLPISLAIWKDNIDQIVIFTVFLELITSCVSILLTKRHMQKNKMQIQRKKFLSIFFIELVVFTFVGWFLRKKLIKPLSKPFTTRICYIMIPFILESILRVIFEIKMKKKKKFREKCQKKEYYTSIQHSIEHSNYKGNLIGITNSSESKSGDECLSSLDQVDNNHFSSHDSENHNKNLLNKDLEEKCEEQKKGNPTKHHFHDFKMKHLNTKKKFRFKIAVIFIVSLPNYVLGSFFGMGIGSMFVNILPSFGFDSINSSLIARAMTILQLSIIACLYFLTSHTANIRYFLPRISILLPLTILGLIIQMTELKLAILGTAGSGKSSILVQFLQNFFIEEYDPTIEDTYKKHAMIDNQTYILNILDTAGAEEYSSLRDSYLRKSAGFFVVYSITNRGSFLESKRFVEEIHRCKNKTVFPIMVVGNKTDLEFDRQVSQNEGMDFAKSLHCSFIETSAKTNTNIEKSFFDLVREIKTYCSKNNIDISTYNANEKTKEKCHLL
ncbi:ras gtpase-related [Anaeramoeba flamelloides]|uniref:Ras gtpase-related n=1 Tax=Anaeramoeba flamelloides TaxID=1746091 RepID=A0AAV7ZTQ2_9EUKA|nr:ras gtpase-related [Anaeramoeba flamelloides]